MISTSLRIIRENWPFYLFFVIAMLVVSALADAGIMGSTSAAGTTVIWLLLARYVHRSALFDIKFGAPNQDGTPDTAFGGFIFKGVALSGLSVLLAIPVFIGMASSDIAPVESQAPDMQGYLPFIGAMLLIYAALLGLVGSWLPATVYRQNTSLVAAFKRGLRNFLPVFLRIAATIAAVIFVQLVLLIAAGMPGIPGAALIALQISIEAFGITLTSVILSHYYLKAENIAKPVPDASAGALDRNVST